MGVAVHGDPRLGALLRELRRSRNLTQKEVAGRVGCTVSHLSRVESGERRLQPQLAEALERVYGCGTSITGLLSGHGLRTTGQADEESKLLLRLPGSMGLLPLPRRELYFGLSTGALGGQVADQIDKAIARADPEKVLAEGEQAFDLWSKAARSMPPNRLISGMTGYVVVLEQLRQRAPRLQRQKHAALQARYGEALSWLCQEASDAASALYWIDRITQWAQYAGWHAMAAYALVRRAMIAAAYTHDGHRAARAAKPVLDMPHLSRVRGLAHKERAMSSALAGDRQASARELDEALRFLAQPEREDEALLGQRSVDMDELCAVYRTTCEIYLGRSSSAIDVLSPRLKSLASSSPRTAVITRAKLARAYANAGLVEQACQAAWETLDAHETVCSHSALVEVRRTVAVLRPWSKRSNVRDLVHRLRG